MRLLRVARRHPLALLGLLAVAFIGWIWWDAIPARGPATDEARTPHDATGPLHRVLPLPPDEVPDETRPDPTKGLAKLKPGMTRAEVEKLVGAPAAEHVYPATVSDGRVTYHAAYEADLGPPSTIRPIRVPQRQPIRTPDVVGRTLVTLEYDATKPGHPLLGVHYPDPLF